jgi:hypothetical protein
MLVLQKKQYICDNQYLEKMKSVMIFLLCMASALPTLAQNGVSADFGIKAGMNRATVYAVGQEGIGSKPGLTGGVFGELRIKKFALQAEILYSREGYRFQSVDAISFYERVASLNYLNFPLLVKVYPLQWLSLDLGYQTGVLWNTKVRNALDYSPPTQITELENMRSVNNSLVLGATFRLGEHIDLSARYNLGISDLQNKVEGEMLRSRVAQFTIGYRF